MADSPEAELRELVAAQAVLIERLTARVAELERRLGADSSNSSRPPVIGSAVGQETRQAAVVAATVGSQTGKQPGDPGVSRSLSDAPDRVVPIEP